MSKNDFDVKKLEEGMMEMATGLLEAQQKEEEAWISGLEADPTKITPFERGLAVADFKGESARQRHLATVAKTENVRALILKQAEWVESLIARLERLAIPGEPIPTIN